jgi:hypothetical protein
LSSLYDPDIDTVEPGKYEKFEWRRVSEIYENPQIFSEGVDPNDIKQGALGDCYFLAVLSSMAEHTEKIEDLFYTNKINDSGCYLVTFYINGVETPIIIDDYLPCYPGRGPAFAYSRDGEVWVQLLEKAWAKLHKTYARTEGGLPCFACSHLAGVPSESVMHSEIKEDLESFFDLLQMADKRNFTMMAASHGQGEVESADGVISGHAYSLIEIHEFENEGEMVKLLKLRNPWGSGEWQGDWSDQSEKWTPELREKIGCIEADDGFFFITLEDYV